MRCVRVTSTTAPRRQERMVGYQYGLPQPADGLKWSVFVQCK